MSGGHFNYNQYCIGEIADSIEEELEHQKLPNPPTRRCYCIYERVHSSFSSYTTTNYRYGTCWNDLLTMLQSYKDNPRLTEKEVTIENDNDSKREEHEFYGDGHITVVIAEYDETIYDLEGYRYSDKYSKETIREFKRAIRALRRAEVYAQRIDWLLSGDDGEETFHIRLKEDLNKIK